MNRKSEAKFDIREELRLIPKTMVVAAVLVFLGIQVLILLVAFPHSKAAPPILAQIPLGFFGGTILAFFLLLIGYVNRDAKRRGMNSLLWTLLVLFIPNAIGFIIYFVVREPVMAMCPQCGLTVNVAYNFCPKCKFHLHPACPQCHRTIVSGSMYCPYCSAELEA